MANLISVTMTLIYMWRISIPDICINVHVRRCNKIVTEQHICNRWSMRNTKCLTKAPDDMPHKQLNFMAVAVDKCLTH